MLSVLYCFGYILGYLVFFDFDSKLVIVGDVLFNGLIGCMDFFGGDYLMLICFIKEKFFFLGDEVKFILGYGLMLMFGEEKKLNLFVGG